MYPGAEGRDSGVDAGGLLCPAGLTPGRDPVHYPAPSGPLAHQRTPAVTTATVHAPLRLGTAAAEHAIGESPMVVLLAMATGKQGDGGLLQGLRVRAACERGRAHGLDRLKVKRFSYVCS